MPLTVQQSFDLALQHHKAGRLPQAEALYRQILTQQPNHFDALHLLGVIAHQVDRNDIAVDLIRQAIAINPNQAIAHNNLGSALKNSGRIDEAIAAHRQAISLDPNLAEAHNNLGLALAEKGDLDRAIATYQQALALNPGDAAVHCNLGITLKDKGQFDDAIAAQRQAIALNPNLAEAHNNLGLALAGKGQLDQSIAAYRRAIALRPNNPQALTNLANALAATDRLDDAIASCRRAISLAPNYAQAHSNLGNALKAKDQFDESIAAYRQAIALTPNLPEPHHNLGTVLWTIGQLDDAIASYRRAIALNPNFAIAHSNLVYSLHFHPAYDAQSIAHEHRRWNQQHAERLRKFIQPRPANRDPSRRLKIGYVSPDFREHPVGRFMLPILQHHDHHQFEIICYSNSIQSDPITAQLRSRADHWRKASSLTDPQLASQIRADSIDILVDLSGHTAGNRLLVFAQKPAPIQISYLGYPAPTELDTIDYVFTDPIADPIADPPDQTDPPRSQTLYRLPQTNWCFPEIENAPPVSPPPSTHHDHITFGSFNNFAKITSPMLDTWCEILRQVPHSHLLLKSTAFAAPSVRQHLHQHFKSQNLNPTRLKLLGAQPDYSSHLALYSQMDIALDTYPYHGTTTTCDALWMGVPVITLAGQSHVSRVGASLLTNIALPDLIAKTPADYILIAITLAANPQRLTRLRSTLRPQMRRSPLMDAPTFTGNIEAAYQVARASRPCL